MRRNCAPINITGGTGDETLIGELPDIFVANYPNDPEVPNCKTGMDGDKVVVNFPNPGKYGRVLQDPIELADKPADYCTQIPPAQSLPIFEPDHEEMAMNIPIDGPSTTIPQLTTTSPEVVIPTTLIATISESSSISLAPLALGQGANIPIDGPGTIVPLLTTTPPGRLTPTIFSTTIPESSSIIVLTTLAIGHGTTIPLPGGDDTTMPQLTTTPPAIVIPTTFSTTISSSSSIDLAPSGAVPNPLFPKPNNHAVACPTHGAVVCLDDTGSRFGVCNWGWATPQDVAEGTECKAGEIVKRGEHGGGEHGFIGVVMGESKGSGEGEMRRVVQDEDGVPRVVMDDGVGWE